MRSVFLYINIFHVAKIDKVSSPSLSVDNSRVCFMNSEIPKKWCLGKGPYFSKRAVLCENLGSDPFLGDRWVLGIVISWALCGVMIVWSKVWKPISWTLEGG